MLPGDLPDLLSAVENCVVDGNVDFRKWGTQFSRDVFPLWMLKNLPNMPACHVGIAINARGPNNTIVEEENSGLQALIEAAMIIDRDQADVMVVGAVGGRVGPTRLVYRVASIYRSVNAEGDGTLSGDQPRCDVCVPFDRRRRGIVPGEGAAALVIERRSHAVRRGAKIYGELVGFANRFASPTDGFSGSRKAIVNAIRAALAMAEIEPREIAFISAQGYSGERLDIEEAQAIAEVCSGRPVTAFSSYFGTAGAGCGLMELMLDY